MTTDFCAALQKLLNEVHDLRLEAGNPSLRSAVTEARAALAEQPVMPTDEEIMELMPRQMHEDLAAAARAMAGQAGTDNRNVTGMMRIILNRHAVDLARAVLARWGNPAPQLPTDGEVAEVMGLFRHWAEAYPDSVTVDPYWLTRAADLLQRLSPPQPVPEAK